MRAEIFDKHCFACTQDVRDASEGVHWDDEEDIERDGLRERFPWADCFAHGFGGTFADELAKRKDPFDPSKPEKRYIPPEAFDTPGDDAGDDEPRAVIWDDCIIVANRAAFDAIDSFTWKEPTDAIKARHPWVYKIAHFGDGKDAALRDRQWSFDEDSPVAGHIPPEFFKDEVPAVDDAPRCAIWDDDTIVANRAAYDARPDWPYDSPSDKVHTRYPWAYRTAAFTGDKHQSLIDRTWPFEETGGDQFPPAWFKDEGKPEVPGGFVEHFRGDRLGIGGAVHVGAVKAGGPVYYSPHLDDTVGKIVGIAGDGISPRSTGWISVGQITTKEDEMSQVIKVSELALDSMVAKLDKAFKAKDVTDAKTATAVFGANDLPPNVSAAPEATPRTRLGDFVIVLEDATIMRATIGETVQYAVIRDNVMNGKDYWVRVGV